MTQGREDGEYHYKAPSAARITASRSGRRTSRCKSLLSLAFPRDRQILTRDHPELVRLREDD